MKAVYNSTNPATDRETPRFSLAQKPSTAFSYDAGLARSGRRSADVGRVQARVVAEDDMDDPAAPGRRLDAVRR